MVDIIDKLKKDLKKISPHEKLKGNHIVFKQKVQCGDKKHTNYFKYVPNEKGEE